MVCSNFSSFMVLATFVGLKLLEIKCSPLTQIIRQYKFCVPWILSRIHNVHKPILCDVTSVTTHSLQLLWHSSNLQRDVCHHHKSRQSDIFRSVNRVGFFWGFPGICSMFWSLCVIVQPQPVAPSHPKPTICTAQSLLSLNSKILNTTAHEATDFLLWRG